MNSAEMKSCRYISISKLRRHNLRIPHNINGLITLKIVHWNQPELSSFQSLYVDGANPIRCAWQCLCDALPYRSHRSS